MAEMTGDCFKNSLFLKVTARVELVTCPQGNSFDILKTTNLAKYTFVDPEVTLSLFHTFGTAHTLQHCGGKHIH